MAGAGIKAVAKQPSSGGLAGHAAASKVGTGMWLCAIPCAVVTLIAMLALGPPLGGLVYPSDGALRFMAAERPGIRLEPTEQARFLISLGAPLLLAATGVLLVWRPLNLSARAARLGATAVQGLLAVVVLACVVGQHRQRYGPVFARRDAVIGWSYFTTSTIVVAVVIAAAVAVGTRRADARALAAGWLRESRTRRVGAFALAATTTALWLLHAINSDTSIANTVGDVQFHLGFTLDETFAVLNGRTPLVDFTAQYGSLWPFVVALPLLALGKTLLVFTIAMCTISAIALIAIFDVLRRVTRSALAAALLYLPFLATSLFQVRGTLVNRDTFGTYFGMFPLRYAGPYLLAWLAARHLDRGGSRTSAWLLFVAAGIVLLNNVDFGLPALGATVAALVWTSQSSRASLLRLAGSIAAGLATALLLVSALTLVRAGSLPHLSRLTEYARVYAVGGFGMLPIQGVLGLHVVIFLTYVAAISTATMRAVDKAPERVLTGMLAWTGIFGLGSGSYFIGRSHPEALIACFSTWALALMLLTVVVVRSLAANPARRPSIAALLVLTAFGVCVCSLAQTPLPWSQIERIGDPFVAAGPEYVPSPLLPSRDPAVRRFVSSLADGPHRFVVRRGAPVALLMTTGHRIADAYGVVNVSPYTGTLSIQTVEHVEAVLAALRRAGGNTVVLPTAIDPGIYRVLAHAGFEVLTSAGLSPHLQWDREPRPLVQPWANDFVTKWVDTRHLHPEALR